MGLGVPQHAGDNLQSSPSTMWVLGVEVRLSGLVVTNACFTGNLQLSQFPVK